MLTLPQSEVLEKLGKYASKDIDKFLSLKNMKPTLTQFSKAASDVGNLQDRLKQLAEDSNFAESAMNNLKNAMVETGKIPDIKMAPSSMLNIVRDNLKNKGQGAFDDAIGKILSNMGDIGNLDELMLKANNGKALLEVAKGHAESYHGTIQQLSATWQRFAGKKMGGEVSQFANAVNNINPKKMMSSLELVKETTKASGKRRSVNISKRSGLPKIIAQATKFSGSSLGSGGKVIPVYVTNMDQFGGSETSPSKNSSNRSTKKSSSKSSSSKKKPSKNSSNRSTKKSSALKKLVPHRKSYSKYLKNPGNRLNSGKYLSILNKALPKFGKFLTPLNKGLSNGGKFLTSLSTEFSEDAKIITSMSKEFSEGGKFLSSMGKSFSKGGKFLTSLGKEFSKGGKFLGPIGRSLLKGGKFLTSMGKAFSKSGKFLTSISTSLSRTGKFLSSISKDLLKGGKFLSSVSKALRGGNFLSPITKLLSKGSKFLTPISNMISKGGSFLTPVTKAISKGGNLLSPLGNILSKGGKFLTPLMKGVKLGGPAALLQTAAQLPGLVDTLQGDGSNAAKGEAVGEVAGDTLGSMGGMAVGAAIGTMIFPGVGTVIGGAIGSMAGSMAGGWIGGEAGNLLGGIFDSDSGKQEVGGKMIIQVETSGDLNAKVRNLEKKGPMDIAAEYGNINEGYA